MNHLRWRKYLITAVGRFKRIPILLVSSRRKNELYPKCSTDEYGDEQKDVNDDEQLKENGHEKMNENGNEQIDV